VDVSRDIIGKYERGEHSPSIEITTKLADVLEVSVDFMLGRERFGKYDNEAIKRLEAFKKWMVTLKASFSILLILISVMLKLHMAHKKARS
jgi:transcriptional regulator with XRE-family HTH domain